MDQGDIMDRYSRKDAEAAFERLATALHKPIGHYRPLESGETSNYNPSADFSTIPGGWALDYSAYGGYVVHQIDQRGGTGVYEPFGSRRRSTREFCDAVRFALDALDLERKGSLIDVYPAGRLCPDCGSAPGIDETPHEANCPRANWTRADLEAETWAQKRDNG